MLGQLQKADKNETPETLETKASSFTNPIRGLRCMNALQMTRGYSASIFGMPGKKILKEMIEAHVERESTKAIER